MLTAQLQWRRKQVMHTSTIESTTAAERDEGGSHHMASGKGCWLVRSSSLLRSQAHAQNKRVTVMLTIEIAMIQTNTLRIFSRPAWTATTSRM